MSSNISRVPIDQAHTLRSSHILYIRPGHDRLHSEVLDLTSHLLPSYNDAINPDFQETVRRVLRANPAMKPTWHVNREHRYSNASLKVFTFDQTGQDGIAGEAVATLHSPILAFSTTTITFSPSSPHSSHKIIVSPTSTKSRLQAFVKDSIPYLWESFADQRSTVTHHSTGCVSLYKADSTKRTEVARYASHSGRFEVGGMLLVKEREVDVLVAVVTLLGVLGQRDSFRIAREV